MCNIAFIPATCALPNYPLLIEAEKCGVSLITFSSLIVEKGSANKKKDLVMPKRIGYIANEVIADDNLEESFKYVLRGKRKESRCGKKLMENKTAVIESLKNEISTGTFKIKGYTEFKKNEYGKERIIQSIRIYDRIGLNAVMRVLEAKLRNRLIINSAACVKGRGTHWLFTRLKRDLSKLDPQKVIIRKDDISKFYESIPKSLAKTVIRHYIKDPIILGILDDCIGMKPTGISIGLRSSQLIGSLVLTYVLDHNLKDKYGLRHYYRYCDDGVEVVSSMYKATEVSRLCHKYIENAGLRIKPNEQIWHWKDRPLDFLGYKYYSNGKVQIRKHIKQRFARRWKRVKSIRRKKELLASFYGICKHANAKNLFKKMTGMEISDFAKSGFQYQAKDGKKHFDVPKYRLSELMNRRIVVLDYEVNVKTAHGEKRTLVLFRFDNGQEGKFWTGGDELLQAIKYMDEQNKIPFYAEIGQRALGDGKFMYVFKK